MRHKAYTLNHYIRNRNSIHHIYPRVIDRLSLSTNEPLTGFIGLRTNTPGPHQKRLGFAF